MTQRTDDSLRLRLRTRSTSAKSSSIEHNRSRTNRTYMVLRRRVHYKRRSTRAKLLDVQKHFTVTKRSRRSVVGIVTRLWACRSGVRIPVGERDLSLLQNVHTGYEDYPASYSVGTGILYRACGLDMKLTTHLHLTPSLRISETTQISTPHVHFHGMNTGDSAFHLSEQRAT
jgi:hypothetical protein